jgi:hypothetical protein
MRNPPMRDDPRCAARMIVTHSVHVEARVRHRVRMGPGSSAATRESGDRTSRPSQRGARPPRSRRARSTLPAQVDHRVANLRAHRRSFELRSLLGCGSRAAKSRRLPRCRQRVVHVLDHGRRDVCSALRHAMQPDLVRRGSGDRQEPGMDCPVTPRTSQGEVGRIVAASVGAMPDMVDLDAA